MSRATKTSPARSLLAWTGLILLVGLGPVVLARSSVSSSRLPVYDWVLYWSAGQLSLQGQDPYARENLFPLQKHDNADLDESNTILFYNPPWSLPLLMAFGVFRSLAAFQLAWGLMLLATMLFSADWLWRYGGGPAAGRPLAWLLPFTFLPVLHVIQSGQIGPLVLLGIVGFLYFADRGWDWAAGAVLLLAAVKPHLVGLFWLALLLWAVDRRRWRVLAGGLLTGAVATALPLFLNPQLLAEYAYTMTHHSPSEQWITPTIGSVLRLLYRALGLGDDLPFLQYVPALIGAVWLPAYYLRRRHGWNWSQEMPVLLFASFLAAPYGAWVADMVVLLLPVMLVAARCGRGGRHAITAAAAGTYLAVNGVAGWMCLGVHFTWWFFWMPPALGLLYLCRDSSFRAHCTPDGAPRRNGLAPHAEMRNDRQIAI